MYQIEHWPSNDYDGLAICGISTWNFAISPQFVSCLRCIRILQSWGY